MMEWSILWVHSETDHLIILLWKSKANSFIVLVQSALINDSKILPK